MGLRSTYTIRLIRLSLIEKRLVDFPFVLIELFLPGVKASALRAEID